MFERAFRQMVLRYISDQDEVDALWNEIKAMHSTSRRHYHSLDHLEHIHQQLRQAKDQVQNEDALVLATGYHDIIQNMARNDDEERSVELMRDRLRSKDIPTETIERAAAHILATRSHEHSKDPDTGLFTDADLCILGASRQEYERYADQIRQEYVLVPDLIYNLGRKKVLTQFLQLQMIFKSPIFHYLEAPARANINWEIERL